MTDNNISNVSGYYNVKQTANWLKKDLCSHGRIVSCNIYNSLQNKQCSTCGCGGYEVEKDQLPFPNGTLFSD